MSSIVEVYNLAATRMGSVTRVSSPDDDRHVARTIRGVFDMQRRASIREGAWNFATRRAELAAEYDPDRVIFPWAYAYPLPADNLRFLGIISKCEVAYSLEEDRVHCDLAGPLRVRYLIDRPEPATWDEGFAESFALRLAWRCGRTIAGSAFDQGQCEREYRASLSGAKRVDARENPGPEQAESGWVEARFSGGAGSPARPWR